MAFAANQRDEVRDLGIRSGALAAQPGMKQQTFVAERCLNPWDTQQARVSTQGGAAPTLSGADGGGGRNPAGLVFVPQGRPRKDSAVAAFCAGAAPSAGGIGYSEDVSPTLKAGACGFSSPCVCEPRLARTLCAKGDSSPCVDRSQNVVTVSPPAVTMRLREGCEGGGKGPLLQVEKSGALATHGDQYLFAPAVAGDAAGSHAPVAAFGFDLQQITSRQNRSTLKEVQPSLCAAGNPHVVATGAHPRAAAPEPIPIHDRATRHNGGGVTRKGDGSGNGLGVGEAGGPAPTLTSGDCHSVAAFSRQRFDLFKEQDAASTQAVCRCKGATDIACKDTSGSGRGKPARAGYVVRRLTPTECERLQGFPDGWTRLGAGGEGISDTRRYQMLGNSLAIPCVAFVLGNIAAQMGGEAANDIDIAKEVS
jgi:DNA (cytosine-5)-methyltransferase 1